MLHLLTKERTSRILALALPAALNSLLDMVNILVDLMMVGHLSPHATVAVGVGLQYMMLVFALITAFMVGTNALISRLIGAGEQEEAGRGLFSIAITTAIFTIPLTLFCLQVIDDYYAWMDTAPESTELGIAYLHILLMGLPLLFTRSIFVISLSASGDTRTPFKIKIIGSIANILLDYVLIFGHFGFPAMGVAGAALASIIVFGIEFLLLGIILIRGHSRIRFIYDFRFSLVRRALKVGIPTALERLLTFSAMVYFSKIIAAYGTASLAGYQVGLRIEGIAFMPGVGFMIASMALIGQNIGAKNLQEAEDSVLATAMLAGILMGSLGLVMILIPEWIAQPFSNDPSTIAQSALYLRIIGISQLPLALMFVLDGGLRGAGATRTTLAINALSLWGLRVLPAHLIAGTGGPLFWIFALMSAETFSRAFILHRVFKLGLWRKIEV